LHEIALIQKGPNYHFKSSITADKKKLHISNFNGIY